MPAPQIQTVPTEYKPWGLTAGAMVGQQQYDTEAANLQSLNEARLANVGHERDAMLAQGQMDNPAWLQSKIAGDIGQGQTLAATGEYDQGVLKSKLAEGIAKNVANLSENQVKQQLAEGTKQLNTMKLGLTYLAGPNGQNPAALTGFLQKYGADMGLPPEIHQQLLQAEQQKPGSIKQAISALIPHLQEAISITPQVYADMAKQKQQGEITEGIHKGDRASHEKIGASSNSTTLKSMQMQIDAGRFNKSSSQLDVISTLIKQGRYEGAAVGLSMLAMQEEDPVKKQQLLQQAAMYEQMAKEKPAGGAVRPDAISQTAITQLPGQQQTPSRILNQGIQPVPDPLGIRK